MVIRGVIVLLVVLFLFVFLCRCLGVHRQKDPQLRGSRSHLLGTAQQGSTLPILVTSKTPKATLKASKVSTNLDLMGPGTGTQLTSAYEKD